MTAAARRPGVRRRSLLAAGVTLPALTGLAACDGGGEPGEVGAPDVVAEVDREAPGPVEDVAALTSPFTARLLGALDREAVNLVCSPLSAQVALSMAALGAAGATREQMEQVLGGAVDDVAAAANTLTQVLASVGDEEREEDKEGDPEPAVATLVNGTWVQEDLALEDDFVQGLGRWFGSGVYQADFADDGAREKARERINGWVADATNDLIEDLVPDGMLDAATRLVLVNALHLKAAWPQPLTAAGGTFTAAGGEELSVEMLSGTTDSWYEDELCRATALETHGSQLSLALIRPTEDVATVLDAWSETADAVAGGGAEAAGGSGSGLAAVLAGLQDSRASTEVTLPGFDIEWQDQLKGPLSELGMADAFTDAADFSGITSEEELMLTHVVQKAVITVDEEGMEAAAATAVGAGASSAQADVHELVLDVPFLYVAFETSTRAPLVLGWIGDPTRTR
ncbi:serpin family protein [Brachybacterium fresconis]|uniref:Serpin B n=1 Tax=Brachybacterium fresconis TaxID=173363 RepID=A0ABS4YMQ3_9MICO|nr:serpin family protein [Brachybacterium fresconis]MBP2410076.1 serpin B [Brachybacterium fresconis]